MSAPEKPETGAVLWTDLTVENADEVRDFYGEVVGWAPEPVEMDGYKDYVMKSPGSGNPVVGVCHAQGTNADLPPQWLVYVAVANLDRSIERCAALGGRLLVGPKGMGSHGKYCVVQDPAGAVLALMEPAD